MRPVELEQLIEDLKVEKPHSAVVVQAESKMVLVDDDDGDGTKYVFDQEECKLLLSSPSAVERLFEAVNYPEEAFIELYDLSIDPEIMSELEKFAQTVDEM